MPFVVAALVLLGLLCLLNLLLTVGILRRMRAQSGTPGRCSRCARVRAIGEFAATTTDGEPVTTATLTGTVAFFSADCAACHDLSRISSPTPAIRAATTSSPSSAATSRTSCARSPRSPGWCRPTSTAARWRARSATPGHPRCTWSATITGGRDRGLRVHELPAGRATAPGARDRTGGSARASCGRRPWPPPCCCGGPARRVAGLLVMTAAAAAAPIATAWLTKLVLDRLVAPHGAVGGPRSSWSPAGSAPPRCRWWSTSSGRRSAVAASTVATDRLFAALGRQVGLRTFENPAYQDRLRLAQESCGRVPEIVDGVGGTSAAPCRWPGSSARCCC